MTLPHPAPGIASARPDELLYSLIARSARYLGYWSSKGLAEAIFGRRCVLASPDLQGSLELLGGLAMEAWGLTLKQLALRHTLVGYYTNFLGEAQKRKVILAMLGKQQHLHVRLGICTTTVLGIKRFRLCPHCSAQDMERYGETYWRRSHHIPGALVCTRHGVRLHESDVPFRPLGRNEYVAATIQMLQSGTGPKLSDMGDIATALRLAKDCEALLDARVLVAGPLHDYRPELQALGFVGRRGGTVRFRTAFAATFGDALLRNLFKSDRNGEVLRWLEDVGRRPRRPLHPLKHVLMRQFILSCSKEAVQDSLPTRRKFWGLYRESALREQVAAFSTQGLTTNAIASALGLDWKTASRLLAPLPALGSPVALANSASDRQAWLALCMANRDVGRTALRRFEPALYARLYRRDSEWLLQQETTRVVRKPNRSRVDWKARDMEVAEQIMSKVGLFLKMSPAVRVSRSRVLGVLGYRALMAFNAQQLPLSDAALCRHCESVRAFQVRRIALVLQSDLFSGDMPLWLVLRKARINPDRFSDGGSSLLAEAKRTIPSDDEISERRRDSICRSQ